MERLELGSSPNGEECVQVSRNADYMPQMREECKRFKAMLEARFPIPDGVRAWFAIVSNPHDFGSYLEVVVKYDEDDDESSNFAYYVEGNLPETWDDNKVMVYGEENEGKRTN